MGYDNGTSHKLFLVKIENICKGSIGLYRLYMHVAKLAMIECPSFVPFGLSIIADPSLMCAVQLLFFLISVDQLHR